MKKKMNAFTLIELLAVIVILAIIALIATPIILGIVEDAKKDAFLRSVELIVSTTDIDISKKTFDDEYTYDITNGNVSDLEIGIKNTEGLNGNITYNVDGYEMYAIHNGVYCVKKTMGSSKVEISDYNGDCSLESNSSCFTYYPIYENYQIVDKNKCFSYFRNYDNFDYMECSDEHIEKICNNEVVSAYHTGYEEMSLTESLNNNIVTSIANDLMNNGAITATATNNLMIADYNDSCPRDVVIPSKIDGKTVTKFATSAFETVGDYDEDWNYVYKNQITSIKLPNTIESIGTSVFANNALEGELDLSHLTNLKSIGYGAFGGNADGSTNQISSLKLPSSLESIGWYAFQYNKLSRELDLSNTNLKSIGYGAFAGNYDASTNQITSIKFPNSIESIGSTAFSNNAFSGELDLSYLTNLTSVDGFSENKITSVKLPVSVTNIGEYAFADNALSGELDLSDLNNLTSISGFNDNQITGVKLPNSVVSIGYSAFADNDLSGELDLSVYPNLTSIEYAAFEGNQYGESTNQITSIKLPNSVTSIGSSAFAHNKLSGELDLSKFTNLTSIGSFAFEGKSDGSTNQITNVKFPSSLENIGVDAFAYNKISDELDLSVCINLKSVDGFDNNQITSIKLPSTLESIGQYAFKHNKLSGELDLSKLTNLTSIGTSAFEGKSDGSTNQITIMKFPKTLINIGEYAFRYNPLTSVTFYGRSDLTGVTLGSSALGSFNTANITFITE